jgi:uncharacterized protein
LIVYEATKQEFLEDVFHDELFNQQLHVEIGKIKEREVRSWNNIRCSICIVFWVIMRFPVKRGVAIEFKFPQTSRQVDFLI